MGHFSTIKEEAYLANMEISKQKLAIYTFGNASSFDPDLGVYAIKPSGVPYDELSPEKMVVVDLENNIVEGELRPSSDTKTHTILYRHFEGIGGICHTHSAYAVAWAQAKRAIPIFGTTHADHLTVEVPVTEVMNDEAITRDYETETGKQILSTFESINYKEVEMVLVACHGPFSWGKDAMKAVYNSAVLEELAKMATLTLQINPAAEELKQTIRDKHYYRKHGKNAYYGQL
ncbi:L-ribulose-5-phosphate 4-epimerase AraD [Sediminispirochaeta bajacaliforniensis]|uniref:L-ribulose-5-phosphate 4-epimerase AraD n=1 Tax=Sediminispirochaeta bajacaliforniensis TaxID=148 RepID=UPI0003813285|nr:L-ribulose-5-phosphate 4-epimerase AraD [Sediminispirochaeta bajacaliforniensis]